MSIFADEAPSTLFGQVLDWMLAPLAILWPAAVVGTYLAVGAIVDEPFDRELEAGVAVIGAELAQGTDDDVDARLRARLQRAHLERLQLQVSEPGGHPIAGDREPWAIPSDVAAPSTRLEFRDVFHDEERIRIAYRLVGAGGKVYLVQAAEPLVRRQEVLGSVTHIVMVLVGFLVPLTVALVWLGLRHGLKPLSRLRGRIEARDPDDLSAIPSEDVPFEIAPLVSTLNRQLERVGRNLEAQRRFVADAAHQMKTPLAGLKTQAEAALRGATFEEARTRLERIEESAERMSRLVAQLLVLARADDARTHAPPREPVDLNALLHECCAEAADRALARDVVIGFDPAPGPVGVDGTLLLLRELFSNLLDNAVRYTEPGGEVAVRVSLAGAPEVVVDDTGIGIPQSERERIFDPFYRVLGSSQSGSGLGLSIVKAIATLHDAGVVVEDAPAGAGTRIRVRFPESRAETALAK